MISRIFKKRQECDTLAFIRKYEISRTYSTSIRHRYTDLDNILYRVKSGDNYSMFLSCSKFNNQIYPFFDIDDINLYQHFCQNTSYNYVTFKSSKDHHWVFIDKPYAKYRDFTNDNIAYSEWVTYCDKNYVKMANNNSRFVFRIDFEKLDRQPIKIYESKNLSNNFKLFMDKLDKLFETESVEISMFKI